MNSSVAVCLESLFICIGVKPGRLGIQAPTWLGVVIDSGLGLFPEELLQDSDDAAGFRQVTVLCSGILQ